MSKATLWPCLFPPTAQKLSELNPGGESAFARRRKLLVVDDNHVLAEYLGVIARAFFIELFAAASLAAAREQWAAHGPFEALLLDVRLTNGSGVDFYRSLVEAKARVQVVFLTGYHTEALLRQVEAIGPARVHDKNRAMDPAFMERLLECLGCVRRQP